VLIYCFNSKFIAPIHFEINSKEINIKAKSVDFMLR